VLLTYLHADDDAARQQLPLKLTVSADVIGCFVVVDDCLHLPPLCTVAVQQTFLCWQFFVQHLFQFPRVFQDDICSPHFFS